MLKLSALLLLCACCVFAQTATTTTVGASANPGQIGQTITLTATVAPAATGTVMFLDNFDILGSALLNGSSTATLPIRFTVPKTYRIRAVYAGAGSFAGSTSSVLNLPVKSLIPAGFGTPFTIPSAALLVDVNRDGIPDLVDSSSNVHLAVGNGAYGAQIPSASGTASAIADFNGDGKPDLLTSSGDLAPGNGDGTWGLPLTTGLGFRVVNYSVDVNRDGKADAIVTTPPIGHGQGTTQYWLGNGAGGFTSGGGMPGPVSLANFNGNSTADALFFVSSTIPVGATALFDLNPGNIAQLAVYPTSGLLVGDINGDGLDDVMTNRSVQATFDIVAQMSTGTGAFGPAAIITSGRTYHAIQLLDWNLDSSLDIVVIENLDSSTARLDYLPNRGDGTFGSLIPIAVLPIPFGAGVSVGEVNGDGYPDILLNVGGSQPQPVTVFAGSAQATAPVTFQAPTSVDPNSGSGDSHIFVANYASSAREGSPAPRISLAYMLFNSSLTGQQGCFVEASMEQGTFRLWSDTAQDWLGPIAGSSSQTLSNGLCSLSGSGSTLAWGVVSGTLTEYHVAFNVRFGPTFVGGKNIYLLSIGNDGSNSGWKNLGTWSVTAPSSGGPVVTPGGAPSVGSFSPKSGGGPSATFTGVFSHTAGPGGHYLGYMLFLPTPNVVNFMAQGSCLVEYNRISNGMRLIDDAGTGWLGGVSGLTIGQPGYVLSNSACTVHVANATASLSGNTMSVTVPVSFAVNFGPRIATFLQELDVSNKWTGMTQFGDWTVSPLPDTIPGPRIISAGFANSGPPSLYTVVATATAGSVLTQIHMRTGTSIVGSPVCHVVFAPQTNSVALIDDSETALVTGNFVTIGTNLTLANSRCSFNAANVSLSHSGLQATASIPITYTNFPGFKTVYVNVFDDKNRLTHWRGYDSVSNP